MLFVAIFLTICIVGLLVYFISSLDQSPNKNAKNPFSQNNKKIKDFEFDQKVRDSVLKNNFASSKLPTNVNAVIIGSGIGGLSAGAILSKAGWKVLVLEQHDQVGGCCHTFEEDGYEWDVGIHYIGDMHETSTTKFLLDQITDTRTKWNPLDDEFDHIVLQKPNEPDQVFKISSNFYSDLKKWFPESGADIDKIVAAIKGANKPPKYLPMLSLYFLKMIPDFASNLLINSGVMGLLNIIQSHKVSLKKFLDDNTSNELLKFCIGYNFGDHGTEPSSVPYGFHAGLVEHFMKSGGYYPVGGSSEIAFNIIPTIQKSGGACLTNAYVHEILISDTDGKSVTGVQVKHGASLVTIDCPVVISACGVTNTFRRLLPTDVAGKSKIYRSLQEPATSISPGIGAISVFVGLKGDSSELNLPARNYWMFTESDLHGACQRWISNECLADAVESGDCPMLFASFPSAKDPLFSKRRPGKSTATLITLAPWKWFVDYDGNRERDLYAGEGLEGPSTSQNAGFQKRNKREAIKDYEILKKKLALKMWDRVLSIYPELEDRLDYIDCGTPLTNNYYLGANVGEIYGLDHNMARFDASMQAQLKPVVPEIPGLYLTGQDILSCGFVGGLYAGLLTAQSVLGRDVFADLRALRKDWLEELRNNKDSNHNEQPMSTKKAM